MLNKFIFIIYLVCANFALADADFTSGAFDFRATQSAEDFLRSVGGEFSHVIRNFHRSTQKKSNWCWAAASEIIFYALTGTTLDQAELSHFKIIEPTSEITKGNWRFRDLIKHDEKNCRFGIFSFESPGCNRIGNTVAVLDTFDFGLSVKDYPPVFSKDFFDLARKSIENDVPFGVLIHRPAGNHIVVVFGLSYTMNQESQLSVQFHIYDPEDGATTLMDATNQEFRKNDSVKKGLWLGEYYMSDFTKKGSRPPTQACRYLTKSDQILFCQGIEND